MYPNTLKNRVGNSQFAPTCPVRSAEHLIGSTYPGELSGIATAVPHGDHPLLVSGRHDIPAMIPSYWLLSDREDVCTLRSTSSNMSVTICLPFWDHPKTQKRTSPLRDVYDYGTRTAPCTRSFACRVRIEGNSTTLAMVSSSHIVGISSSRAARQGGIFSYVLTIFLQNDCGCPHACNILASRKLWHFWSHSVLTES